MVWRSARAQQAHSYLEDQILCALSELIFPDIMDVSRIYHVYAAALLS